MHKISKIIIKNKEKDNVSLKHHGFLEYYNSV